MKRRETKSSSQMTVVPSCPFRFFLWRGRQRLFFFSGHNFRLIFALYFRPRRFLREKWHGKAGPEKAVEAPVPAVGERRGSGGRSAAHLPDGGRPGRSQHLTELSGSGRGALLA